MLSTTPMTPIIWLNLLLCISSDKNETFSLLNLDTGVDITHLDISDSFDIPDYNNFEPLFNSEFPSDPSQPIDFTQLSEIEDIGSKESKSETDLITNAPHLGFSNSYDLFGHTNLESSLGSHMDSYRNAWRDANGELRTNDDNLGYPSTRDAQGGTSSSLNPNNDDVITYMHLPGSEQSAIPIYFHQLTLSSDDTSGQHGNAEQSDIDNKHFSNNLNILDYRGNTDGESKTDAQGGTSSSLNPNTDDIITYMHLPGSEQSAIPIYFHQLTLSSEDTSGQHGNAEQSNIDNKHFSNSLNVLDYRGNTDGESEADAQNETSSPLNFDTDDIITYMHFPDSQQSCIPIYFHQLTLSSNNSSSQSAADEQSNIDNRHFSDNLNIPDYRRNTSETDLFRDDIKRDFCFKYVRR
uniref:Subtilisin n=1 Tax=Wuchereria bancrofti TaxID=6293 RepID=A0AAF5Q6U1_WUCBA